MKIPYYLGSTLEKVQQEFKRKKPQYCEGCGILCKSYISHMNTLFDEDTGKRIETYMVETKCPKKSISRFLGFKHHMGDSTDEL